MPTFQELLGSRLAALGTKSQSSPAIPDIPPPDTFSVGGYGLIGGPADRSSLKDLEGEAAYREQEARIAQEREDSIRRRQQYRKAVDQASRMNLRNETGFMKPPTSDEQVLKDATADADRKLKDDKSSRMIQSSPFARMAVVRARAQDLIADGMDPSSAMQQAEEEKTKTDAIEQSSYELELAENESKGQGLREGSEIGQRVVLDVASAGARLVGARETADNLLATSEGVGRANEELRTKQDKYKSRIRGIARDDISRAISSAGQSIGKTTMAAPATLVGGPVAGLAAMNFIYGTDAWNNGLKAAEDAGLNGNDRYEFAVKETAAELLLMNVMQRIPGFGGTESLALKPIVRQSLAKTSVSALTNLTGEVIEEVGTDILHRMDEVSAGVDPSAMDPEKLSAGLKETIGVTLLTTAMMGSPQVASTVRNYIADPTRTKLKELSQIEEAEPFVEQVTANGSRGQRESVAEKLKPVVQKYEETGAAQTQVADPATDVIAENAEENVDSLPTDGTGVQEATPAPGVSSPPLTPAVNEQPGIVPQEQQQEQKPVEEPWYPGQVPTYQPSPDAVSLGTGDEVAAFYEPSSGATFIVDQETQKPITGLEMRKFESVEQAAEWAKSQGIATTPASDAVVDQKPPVRDTQTDLRVTDDTQTDLSGDYADSVEATEAKQNAEIIRLESLLRRDRDELSAAKKPGAQKKLREKIAATTQRIAELSGEAISGVRQREEESPASAKAGRDMKRGDRFADSKGELFEVWKSRQGTVEAHPVVDGNPVVNRDTMQRFAVTPQSQARNPDDRIDVAQVQASSTDVSPSVTQEELGQLLIDNEPQIRKVVSSNIKDQATVDDLVQDVNAKVLEKGWDPSRGEFKKWVSRVARNTRIDHGRKQSASNQVQGDQEAMAQVPDVSSQRLEPDEAMPAQAEFDPDQGVVYSSRKDGDFDGVVLGPAKRKGYVRVKLNNPPKGTPPVREVKQGTLTARELTEEEKQPKAEPTFDDKTREMIAKQEPLKSFTPAQKVIYTDAKGNVTEATVIRQKGRKVQIRRSDGRTGTVGQNRLTEPTEDPFVRIARDYEVTENEIRQYLPQVHEQAVAVDAERQKVRGEAVKRLKINARRINTIEDKGGDLDSIPGFDVASRDFAAEHPEIFGNVDESDVPAAVWDMIKEGKQEIPDLLSEEMLQAAAEEALRVRKSGNAPLTAAEQAEQERQALESIDEFDLEGTDDSFDFGANVEEKPAATIEIAGIGKDGKRTVETVTREEGQKRSVRSVLNLAKAEKITRGEQIEGFAANNRFHNDSVARQSFDSAEEFGAAARAEFEARQNAPIEMKGEPAIREVKPEPEKTTNSKAKQPDLFIIGKNDLPGQETLFGSENFDKKKGSKGGSSDASIDSGLSGSDLPSDVDRSSVETGRKKPADTATADSLMETVSARAIPIPELVEMSTNLLGSPPKVGHRLRRAMGLFKSMEGMQFAEILIRPDLGGDVKQLAHTLAHEIGHLIDWLPDLSMKRGNILGRVGVLNGYLKTMLDAVPTDPSKALTSKDRQKIRRRAEKLVGPKPPKDEEADLAAWREEVRIRYQEELTAEAEVRGLNRKEWINEELNALSEWWRPYDPDNSDEGYAKYRQSSRELYADAMSVMLNAPMELKKRAPLFWDSWNAYLDRKPEVVDNLIEMWDRMAGTPADIAAARRGRIVSGFLKGAERAQAAAQARLDAKQSMWAQIKNFFTQGLLDKFSPIKGRAQQLDDKQTEYLMDELFSADTPGALLFLETQEQVQKPLHDAGISDAIIGEYLFANRIINEVEAEPKLDKNGEVVPEKGGKARFQILNPLGFTQETASEQMSDLKKRLGDERFKLLEDRMQHWHREILWPHVERARDVGVYSSDAFERKLEPNKDSYAAFAVVKYLDSDQISPMLSNQTGTFEEIANPFTFTTAKFWSLSRLNQMNEAKAAVIDKILPAFNEVKELEVAYGKDRPRGFPKPGMKWMTVLRDGKPKWYEVPQEIEQSFNEHDIGTLMQLAKAASSNIYSVAHPLYVTFSPGFLSANPFRDLTRTWHNLGATEGIKFHQVVREWLKSIPEARRAANGEYVEVVREMLKEKAYDIPFHSLMAVKDDVLPFSPEIEKGRVQNWLDSSPENPIARIMRGMQFLGEVQETATKIAGYRLLTEKGVTGKQRAYSVRKYVGTPDYKQKGLLTDLTNGVFMYSKIKWNAAQVAIQLATNKETAAGYWSRAMISTVIPAIIMKMMLQGLFGDEWEEWWNAVPKHDRDNYLIIPMGTRDNNGVRESAYIRLPMDENLIFLHKLTSHLADVAIEISGSKSDQASALKASKAAFGEVADYFIPTTNPGIQVANAWLQYASGVNPIDDYRDQEIVPRYAWEAGGHDANMKMLQWTWNKTGVLSQMTRFATGAVFGSEYSDEEETVIESVLTGVGEATGMRRLFRVSSRGNEQSEWIEVEREQQQRQKMLNQVTTGRTRAVNNELARLRGINDDDVTSEKWTRKKVLSLWQARTYTKLIDQVQAADDERRDQIKQELIDSVRRLDETIPSEYLDSFVMQATNSTINTDVLNAQRSIIEAGITQSEARAGLDAYFLDQAQKRAEAEAEKRNRSPRAVRNFERTDAYYARLRKLNQLFSNSSKK